MERFVDDLKALDANGAFKVDAGTFQEVLDRHQFELGSTLGDEIILRCVVTSTGDIDFSGLIQAPDQNATFGFDSLSVNDNRKRVHLASDQLKEVFSQYDNGRVSMSQLQQSIVNMGLDQTPEFLSIVQHAPLNLNFGKLIKALLQTDDVKSHTAVQMPQRHREPKSNDVIAWGGTQPIHVARASPRGGESMDSPWASEPSLHERHRGKHIHTEKFTSQLSEPEAFPHNTMKENIYSCVRQLAQNVISTDEFRKQIISLGVVIPDQVHRLLNKVNCDGVVNFSAFVCGFESVFHAHAVTPPLPPPIVVVPVKISPKSPSPTTSKSPAQRSHGDVIAWSAGPGELEIMESSDILKGKKHNDPDFQDHRDMLVWQQGAVGYGADPSTHRRSYKSNTSENFLVWDTDAPVQSSTQKSHLHATDTSQLKLPTQKNHYHASESGQEKVATQKGHFQKQQSSVPYGVEYG